MLISELGSQSGAVKVWSELGRGGGCSRQGAIQEALRKRQGGRCARLREAVSQATGRTKLERKSESLRCSDAHCAQENKAGALPPVKGRTPEAQRREQNESVRRQVKQQQQLIQKLRKENESLKHDLGLSKDDLTVSTTEKAISTLNQLQTDASTFANRLEQEQKKAKELEKEKERADEQVHAMRKHNGGVYGQQNQIERCQRHIRILEYRVDREVRRLNEVNAQSRKLRDQIDNIRLERKIYNKNYERKEKELEQYEAQIESITEQRNAAAEEMDSYENELAATQAQADKEHLQYETKWRELGSSLEEGLKREKQTQREAAAFLGSKEHMKGSDSKLRNSSFRRSSNKKKELEQQLEKNQREQREQRRQRMRDCIEQIIDQEADVNSVDELVEQLTTNEDRNDSLFNDVNDLNREADSLEEEIAQLDEAIDQLKQTPSESHNRMKAIEDMEGKTEKARAQAEQYDAFASASQCTIDAIKSKVQVICEQYSCQPMSSSSFNTNVRSPFRKSLPGLCHQLGESLIVCDVQGVLTEEGAVGCLGLVEQKANELLQACWLSSQKSQHEESEDDQRNALGVGLTEPPPLGSRITIEPPTTAGDVDELEEEEEEPILSREELFSKVSQGVQQESQQTSSTPRRRWATVQAPVADQVARNCSDRK